MFCSVCYNEQFDVQDGLYFCTQCQTQSQEVREEQQDDDFRIVTNPATKIKINKPKPRSSKHDLYEYRWTTNDAFNIILKKLVDILIDMGGSPRLKDVVFDIWAKFLNKTQYAFCKPYLKNFVPKVPPLPRERDIQIIINKEKEVKAKRFRRSFLKTIKPLERKRWHERKKKMRNANKKPSEKKKKSKKKTDDTDQLLVDENTTQMSATLENDSLGTMSIESDFLSALSAAKAEEQSKKRESVKKKKPIHYKAHILDIKLVGKIGRMTMKRVLDMLFLALLFVHERVLLCDLIDWIESSKLPFRECVHFLPENMHFQTHDTTVFRFVTQLSNAQIRRGTAQLAKFLEIPKIPTKSLSNIVSRFVEALNLPDEIIQLVDNLIAIDPPNFPDNSFDAKQVIPIPNYEGRALAFIIVALKLLFGLDGKTEKKQDKYSSKLAAIYPEEKLFLWKEWFLYITKSQEEYRRKTFSENLNDLGNFDDTEKVIDYYMEFGEKQKGRPCATRNIKYAYCRDEVRDAVRQAIDKLQLNIAHDPGNSTICGHLNCLETDFSNYTLSHISNPYLWASRLKEHNIELEICEHSALIEPERCSTSDQLTVYQPLYDYPIEHFLRSDGSEYMLLAAATFAPSFVWLVDIFSKCGKMRTRTLYEELMTVERIIIVTEDELKTRTWKKRIW